MPLVVLWNIVAVSAIFWHNGNLSINWNYTRSFSFFQHVSSEFTYPIYTFFSAGLINFFVPSGGGQWYIQGLDYSICVRNGYPLDKSILALAYGDQITNMMQPFWALPLLGITGLKAKDILPYTFLLMLVGIGVFLFGLVFL